MLWVLFVLQFMFRMACGCAVEERMALMRIKASVGADSYDGAPLHSWGRDDNCCSWKGVTCNNSTRVSALNLGMMIMYCDQNNDCWTLNLTIFSSFLELQLLDLSWNDIYLTHFDDLQGLTKLEYLNLSGFCIGNNNILESPAFRTLKNLRELNLQDNQLNGSIPASLFELPHLQYLDLSRNILEGHIPKIEPTRILKNLQTLHLEFNQLNGSIPASLFELPNLEYLGLGGNFLQGRIPMSSTLNLSTSLQTIDLSENNLNGMFDFFLLRNCTNLKVVDLSRNADLAIDVEFHKSVPPLFQLEALRLSGCNLDNSIIAGPNFLGTQRHLVDIDLSDNNLTGSIPTWILQNEVRLIYLNLANNLLVGSLHLMWQQQCNLRVINISMNQFSGQLPTNINSVFPELEILDTSYNIIYGALPSSLCKIRRLEYLDLSHNKLTGEVSACLFTIPLLVMLKLSNNNLGGQILGGASNLSNNILRLYLASNNFEGGVPSNLTGYVLECMDLHDNVLSGELDVSSWNLPSLQVLSVASNRLNGKIYPTICNWSRLHFLDVSDNNFAGSLPNCDSQLILSFLNMSENTMSGSPGDFLNSSSSFVVALDLRYNQFKGSLDWIQHLSEIKLLLLGGNRFEGQISQNLCHLQYFNIIDLSHNRLSGSLPPCIGSISFGKEYDYDNFSNWYSMDFNYTLFNYTSFGEFPNTYDLQGFSFPTKGSLYTYNHNFFNLMFGIDLSGNMLSGEIPWEIGNLSHVTSLNLSHNSFTGPIPTAMANLSAIESLDLSRNKLSGPIPWQLTQLSSLEVFSVAYNNLTGCIPNSGQFSSFDAECYMGNTNLHNLSKDNQCSPAPSPMEVEYVSEASVNDPILYIISAVTFVLTFWATVAFVFCHPFGQRVMLQL